jgi:heptosyltransferase-2
VDKVIGVSRTAGVADLLAMGRDLARRPYRHVFDLHHSLRSRLLTWRLQRRLCRGFSKQELPRWLLVHLHRDWYAHFGGVRSLRERMLDPLRRLGFEPALHPTRLDLPAALHDEAARRLQSFGVPPEAARIGIAPGARWPSKRWPQERFATLVQRLATDESRRFLLFGDAREKPLTAAVTRAAAHAHDCGGGDDLLRTAALLQRCHLLVTNDSGLLHVAEAVGCPVLALFGPTSPAFGYAPSLPGSRLLFAPPPCNPCSKNGSRPCHRREHECMLALDVENAHQEALAILASSSVAAVES